jgi:hypothetical protein
MKGNDAFEVEVNEGAIVMIVRSKERQREDDRGRKDEILLTPAKFHRLAVSTFPREAWKHQDDRRSQSTERSFFKKHRKKTRLVLGT